MRKLFFDGVNRAPKARGVHPLIENKFWLFTLSYVMLSEVEASPGRVSCEMDVEGTGRAPTIKTGAEVM